MTAGKSNFWKTATGMVTGLTGLIAAISALLVALGEFPLFNQATNSTVRPEEVINVKWTSKDFYKTHSADFEFDLVGKKLIGTYNNIKEDARIFDGKITHNIDSGAMIINGYWSETHSNKACSTQKNNSQYWGKLELTFTSKKTIVGRWGYCNEPAENSFSAVRFM